MRLYTVLAAATLALPLATPLAAQDTAQSRTRDGVTLPVQWEGEGQPLVLNGVALRKKFIVKVYVAGLYLPAPSSDAEAILAADEPRLLVMEFLRGVDKGKICDAWNDGLEKNTPDASAELTADFETLCGYMQDVEKGQRMLFHYIPGRGTVVTVAGETRGTIEGKEFADALFKAWIGPKPGPGDGFKKDLLGRS